MFTIHFVCRSGNTKGTTKQPSGTSYGLEEFVDYDGVQVVYGKLGTEGEDHALYKVSYDWTNSNLAKCNKS